MGDEDGDPDWLTAFKVPISPSAAFTRGKCLGYSDVLCVSFASVQNSVAPTASPYNRLLIAANAHHF